MFFCGNLAPVKGGDGWLVFATRSCYHFLTKARFAWVFMRCADTREFVE